jgi:uncharacterized protein
MTSKVFFSSLENVKHGSPLDKIKRLLENCEFKDKYAKNDLVAVKIHFGELGNTAFIRPIFLRPVIEMLKKAGTNPYLTDTNTLYVGMRTNSVDHHHTVNFNGFGYSTLQVPAIIADGLRGENTVELKSEFGAAKKIKVASDIINADAMLVVSHFKGHEVAGFGGTIKNLSMGCASRQGKLEMHSQSKPVVKQSLCTVCGRCIKNCQSKAIVIKDKAVITDKCVGCARCIAVCPEGAITIVWNESSAATQRKMVEYAEAVTRKFNGKILFLNILTSISPACDCYPGNDKPVTHDIGFLAGTDPVALDKASFDLVTEAAGKDPFKDYYPEIDSNVQFEYAEKIGFGSASYELIEIE